MRLVDAAYDLIYLVATVDGYDDAEGRVLAEFVGSNWHEGFDYRRRTRELQALPVEECELRFAQALGAFTAAASQHDREVVLKFVIDLTLADGDLSVYENQLVNRMADAWEIDLRAFLQKYM